MLLTVTPLKDCSGLPQDFDDYLNFKGGRHAAEAVAMPVHVVTPFPVAFAAAHQKPTPYMGQLSQEAIQQINTILRAEAVKQAAQAVYKALSAVYIAIGVERVQNRVAQNGTPNARQVRSVDDLKEIAKYQTHQISQDLRGMLAEGMLRSLTQEEMRQVLSKYQEAFDNEDWKKLLQDNEVPADVQEAFHKCLATLMECVIAQFTIIGQEAPMLHAQPLG